MLGIVVHIARKSSAMGLSPDRKMASMAICPAMGLPSPQEEKVAAGMWLLFSIRVLEGHAVISTCATVKTGFFSGKNK